MEEGFEGGGRGVDNGLRDNVEACPGTAEGNYYCLFPALRSHPSIQESGNHWREERADGGRGCQ